MVEGKDFRHIVRVINTDLDGNKPIVDALRKVKGIGFMFSNVVCSLAKVDKKAKTGNLDDKIIKKIEDIINNPSMYNIPLWMLNRRNDPEDGLDKHLTSANLKFVQDNDIKLMKKIKLYRGVRHIMRLPVRGQRTKSNFRKNKGKVTGVKRRPGIKSGRK